MNRWGVVGSMAMVVAANAFVLVGVAIDRSGGVVQKIELSERELPIRGSSEDNTGISARLSWHAGWYPAVRFGPGIDRNKLTELGFDCRVAPGDRLAESHYQRQPARVVFVVLEFDGPTWQKWLVGAIAASPESTEFLKGHSSRLGVVDVGKNPSALRARYPDQDHYLIALGLIRAMVRYEASKPPEVFGEVAGLVVDEIHVPKPYADTLAGLRGKPYKLTLCYGKRYEPWVCGCRAEQR
jgi:hypothetical protein